MTGMVLRGSRNIFTVRPDREQPAHVIPGDAYELECRLKGKVLKDMEGYYNPLAPGDRVLIEPEAAEGGVPKTGMILAVEKRRNLLTRFNQKGQKSQLIAANIDLILCVTTALSPPFRPRFLDRILIQAEAAGIRPLIICNKYDLVRKTDPGTEERLLDFRRIGYDVLRVSAQTKAGLDRLAEVMAGKTSAMLGQSGVGKSSLVNALAPEPVLKTGGMNEKYDRGNHTTTLSVMIPLPGFVPGTFVIDTPGIRRMVPDGITPQDLALYMKEFAPLRGQCSFGLSCSHRSEPGCRIMEAAVAGAIHKDRYENFLRIGDELGVSGR